VSHVGGLKQFGFRCIFLVLREREVLVAVRIFYSQLLPQLSAACYSIRVIKLLMSQNILKTVYCSYFYSIMNYYIIFWGNSLCSINIFRFKKKAIRIITFFFERLLPDMLVIVLLSFYNTDFPLAHQN
jgi:hypothetical protein